jgi:beta-lactamase superfamily II metal-dependent hydrolase
MTPVFTFFAVDKGNMTLVEFPNGLNMLVDCRVSASRPSPIQYLIQKHIKKLDLCVVTHSHHDHLTGLQDVCERYRPKELWHSGFYFKPDPIFDDWTYYEKLRKGELTYCKPREVKVGLSIVIGDSKISILGPKQPFLEATPDDVNNNGIILSIITGNSHVVITGDTQVEQWDDVDSKALSNVSVFLASHHGRESGFSERIMRTMRPQRIIISDGEAADTCAMAKYKQFAPVSTTRENSVVVRPSPEVSAVRAAQRQ